MCNNYKNNNNNNTNTRITISKNNVDHKNINNLRI